MPGWLSAICGQANLIACLDCRQVSRFGTSERAAQFTCAAAKSGLPQSDPYSHGFGQQASGSKARLLPYSAAARSMTGVKGVQALAQNPAAASGDPGAALPAPGSAA